MIFEDTKELLQKTEEVILKSSNGKKCLINYIDKKINHNTMGFICTGCNYWLILKTIIVAICIWLLLTLKANNMAHQVVFNFIIALILAIIFAPLSIPSKILNNDVKNDAIKQVRNEIIKKGLSIFELQAIKNNLVIMETAFEVKIRISKWIITAIWGVLVFSYTQYGIPLKIFGKNIELITQASMVAFAFMLMIGLFYLGVKSFHRTGKRVFMTLSFALNESTPRNPYDS